MQIYLMLLRMAGIFTTTGLSNNSVHPLVFIFLRGFFIEKSSFYNVIANHSNPFPPSAVSSFQTS